MALFDPLLDPLQGLPGDDLRSLSLRIGQRLDRAFRQGLGHWVLGILLFAIAAGCLRAWWRLDHEHDRDVLSRVDALLGTRHEPRLDPYPGLLSAALTSINRSDARIKWDCPASHAHCGAANAIRRNFRVLAAQVLAAPEIKANFSGKRLPPKALGISPHVPTEDGEPLLHFAEWVPASEWPSLQRRASDAVARVRAAIGAAQPFETERCEIPNPPAERAKAWGLPGCKRGAAGIRTHLVVPPLTYADDKDRALERSRLARAAWLSELIAPAVTAIDPRVELPTNLEDYRLVQAYFISPDHMLRIWSIDDLSDDILGGTLWAAVHYFQIFLSREHPPKSYETPAYLDAGGYGVIKTSCEPIEMPPRTPPAAKTRESDAVGELVGIVCTDVKLPENAVATEIADSPFFDVFHVKIADDLRTSLDIEISRIEPRARTGASRSDLDPEAVRQILLERANAKSLRASKISMIELGRKEDGTPRRAYVLPMASNSQRPMRALLVAPTTPATPFASAMLVSAAILSLGGMCLVAASVTRASRASEYARRVTVLRNLPVGVVEVDPDEDVVMANDRAEEVLGRELPKAHSDTIAVNFRSDLIEDIVVPIDQSGEPKCMKYEEAVQSKRVRDSWSSYFACLRGTSWGRWVRVTAVPVLSEGLDVRGRAVNGKPPATFGIIDAVTKEIECELRELAREAGAIIGDRDA